MVPGTPSSPPSPPSSSADLAAAVVSQIADYAIIRLDPQGVIETWNLGAERLKGWTAEEAAGQHFSIFYPPEDRRAGLPMQLLSAALADGRVEHTGWRVRKDGTRFWGDVVITALHDESGAHTGFAKVTRDLTDRHALEEALRTSEERLRLLIGQVRDYAIIGLDPQGVIRSWNLGAQQVKGWTEEEAVGRHFSIFYLPEDRQTGLPMRLLSTAATEGRVQHSGWRVRKDGTRFWGDVVLTALHDADGALTGFAKVTRDRTDLKRLEDARDRFYATFRHDVRTPVSAIKGYVEMLRSAGPEEQDHLSDRIEVTTDRLLAMVDELLAVTTSSRPEDVLELAPLDPRALAAGVLEAMPPGLDPARVTVHPDEERRVRANPQALHRVLANLLVNALRYSPPASPVDLVIRPAGPAVRLEVTDRGRGIHPDDLPRIFDEYARGRLAEPDGGTGLGLTSVRDLVRRQHGTISIDSEVGRGTTVAVELPAC